MVSPVSGSPTTLKVGSSSWSRCKAKDIFSWSALVFGSIRIEITGSGKTIFSKITGWLGSQSVSPVGVFFKPTKAPRSPAQISSDSFLGIFIGVKEIAPFFQNSGINPKISQRTDKRIGRDFKSQGRERLIVFWRSYFFFLIFRIESFHIRQIKRRRQIINNRVQKKLNAFIFQGASAKHRNQFSFQASLS